MPSKKRRGRFSPATARRKKPKKSLSSNWVENLADSNKGLILRPGPGVKQAAKCKPINWKLRLKNLLKIWKARYHSRWKTAGEDQQISDLTSLLSRKRWTCGKFTNLVPLGCSSARTKAVCLTKLIMSCISDNGKKQGVLNKSCISLAFELSVAVTRQPQGFLVFLVCIRETRILN